MNLFPLHRRRSRLPFLLLLAWLSPHAKAGPEDAWSAMHVFDAARPHAFEAPVAQDVALHVADGAIAAHLPDGTTQLLSRIADARELFEGKGRIIVADISFDGHPDLLIHSGFGYAGLNMFFTAFLWDAQARRFRRHAGADLSNPRLESRDRLLMTIQRSGPVLEEVAYRGLGARLWRWRETIMAGPLARIRWRDAEGRERRTIVALVQDGDTGASTAPEPARLKVGQRRVHFHEHPMEEARQRAYIVRGDEVVVLDANDDMRWLKVRYEHKGRVFLGWMPTEAFVIPEP